MALGALVTIVETVFLIALSRNSAIGGFLYQQAQFSIAYIAFAIVLFGIDTTLLSNLQLDSKRTLNGLRILVWSMFFLAIGISSFYLFNPSTYTITHSGSIEHVAQQLVFWLPLFLTLIIGSSASLVVALRSDDTSLRRYAIWFALSFTLIFIGTLRESTIIPSTGDPLIDLFVAFAPFVAGSFCILMVARSFPFLKNELHALKTIPMNQN